MKVGINVNKKIFIIITSIICLVLVGCGVINNVSNTFTEKKATIITNDGKTVELTAEQMFDQYDDDVNKFNKLYKGATIKFLGTIKYIKENTSVYTGSCIAGEQNKIVFEEGWCLIIGSENTSYDLSDYIPGQKLEVFTGIVSPAFDNQFLQGAADDNRVVWLMGNDEIWKDIINKQKTNILIKQEEIHNE